MRRGRAVLLLLLAAVAVGAAVWAWRLRAQNGIHWQGYAEADYVRVAPTQQGQLVSLAVRRGDAVAVGTPLFAQDEAPDRAARDQAAATLAEAEARLVNLQRPAREPEIAQAEADLADQRAARDRVMTDLKRAQALLPSGGAARQQVDQLSADARSAEAKVQAAQAKLEQLRSSTGRKEEIAAQQATVESARAALAQAEWRLGQRRVTAPADARVADTYALPGETVAAGAPVVSLLPPENIRVRFFVPETDLPRVRYGARVAIGCDRCPPDLTGTVSFVAPQSEYTPPVIYSEQTRAKLVYLIEARPPRDRAALLKPGRPVDVRPLAGSPP